VVEGEVDLSGDVLEGPVLSTVLVEFLVPAD